MQKKHDGIIGRVTRYACCLAVALAASSSSGCSLFQGVENYLTYNDDMNDFVLGWRNGVWARQAWHERKGQFYGQPHFSHFGAGFRAGYENVASGGNGCPPGIAPRYFWAWKYQTPEGQGQVAAWFAGFPHGARAAEEDGAGLYQQIQVSYPIEQQYAPEFQYSTGIPQESPATAPPPSAGEGMPSPLPDVQDAPPAINPQTRTMYPQSGNAELSALRAASVPAGAGTYRDGVVPAAVAMPSSFPIRIPSAIPVNEFQANPWAQTR